jgi:hypothetical protein
MFRANLQYAGRVMESISSDRLQYLIFLGLSLGVLGFVGILYVSNPLLFQRFLGRINPLIAFLCVIALGFILFFFLLSQNWFTVYEKENLKGLLYATVLAASFGVLMILVDTRIIYPEDTNVLLPESLLFYPAMGFFADILFHVLPLTVLLVILSSILKSVDFGNVVWICIPIVSITESIYQMMHLASFNRYPLWAVIYVGIHVFLIGFSQLTLFSKYDFISMYSFRLVYYAFWHIGWGYVRLRLLF